MRRTLARGGDGWPSALDEIGTLAPVGRLRAVGRDVPDLERCIAVVGTRRPTSAGAGFASEVSDALARAGFCVVSGLAVGIDACAHRAAAEAGGHTVAVLGCGLDHGYPAANRRLRARIEETGTVLSEHDDDVGPKPGHFPARNRIIAGLARAVIVVEGRANSGSLITARHALDAGRDVLAVPGSVRNLMAEGPHALIRAGEAALVSSVAEVFDELAPSQLWTEPVNVQHPQGPALTADETAALIPLDDVQTPLARVAALAGLDEAQASLALARLEIRGLCRRRMGGYEITGGGASARRRLLDDRPQELTPATPPPHP